MMAETASTPEAPPEPKRPVKKKSADKGTFAGYVAQLPDPFRPRHLTEAIRLFAADNGWSDEQLAKADPAKFLREHGLPNPLKRFRVMAQKGSQQLEAREYDVVDESEATRLYRADCIPEKEAHSWTCRVFPLDY